MPATPQSDRADATAPAPVRRYWTQRITSQGTWRIDSRTGAPMDAPGEDLAALRAGLGHAALTVPAMWPHYTTSTDGRVTPELEAEHAALSLFGLHQQSQSKPMHKRGEGLGTALRTLHRSDRFSAEAVDRRVAAAVNATSVPALVYRLRGLVTQLRSIGQPLDYEQLLKDITDWHFSASRGRVRRTWSLAYDSWGSRTQNAPVPDAS